MFVTWKYTDEQIRKIMWYIKRQFHLKKGIYSGDFRESEVKLPFKYADKLEDYSIKIAEDMTNYVEKLCLARKWRFDRELEKEYPFRHQMRLQKFLKALALSNGRNVVTINDWREFKQLFKFMNLRFRDI